MLYLLNDKTILLFIDSSAYLEGYRIAIVDELCHVEIETARLVLKP